jgi:diaminopimelate decarboxylase
MDFFEYQNGELCCDGVSIKDIAKIVPTPFYLYSSKTIIRHFSQFQEALKGISNIICYSVKANSNLSILRLLNSLGSGFDIVSGGELYRALQVGASPDKIVYAGVGKTRQEIEMAISSNILMFNVESISELQVIDDVAKQQNKVVKVAIRVNPDVKADTHSYITTGTEDTKFGIYMDDVMKFADSFSKYSNIELAGIHTHIGSQILDVEPYEKALDKVLELIDFLRDKGFFIRYINLGGGFGIIYRDDDEPFTPSEWADIVIPKIYDKNLILLIEPGRMIVGNAGVLITKVIFIKKGRNKNFAIVDAGMNDLIRPALYNSYHKVLTVELREENEMIYDIVGPICETGDFLAKDRILPELKEGDLIAIKSAGAYGSVMSSRYNSRPLCGEVLVYKEKPYIVREPEDYADIIRKERIIDI